MSEYVIGVDIGGTKSHLAIFDTDGNFIDLGHWGCLNHEGLEDSFKQFEDEFKQFVNQTLSRNRITIKQVAFSAFGVAGVDTKRQHIIVSDIIKKNGFEKFTLANDAFLGIPAGSRTGMGICAINGTGCTLAGLNGKGEMFQIGGVGVISADKGGGGYIGERLVSAVYSELFRKGEPTVMTSLLFEKLGITSKYDLVEKIYEETAEGVFDIYKCSPLMFKAANQNDKVASCIFREIAESYANGISCMIEELHFPPEEELYIVLAGSVFVKGEHPLLVDSLKEKVSNDNPGRRIIFNILDVPNVAGAVLWALNSLGKNNYYDHVCSQLRFKSTTSP
jgi:N-acetylglucosamine kinase-like BadF-type ATPase